MMLIRPVVGVVVGNQPATENYKMPKQKHANEGFRPDGISVHESEMLVATADASDELLNSAVSETLHLLRERLAMDVVFVSEFVDGHRVVRVAGGTRSASVTAKDTANPMEEAWGQRILDGRLTQTAANPARQTGRPTAPAKPVAVGAYLSTPVLLSNGEAYGTLCSISFAASPHIRERDLRDLQSAAQLIAIKIEKSPGSEQAPYIATEPSPLTLLPK